MREVVLRFRKTVSYSLDDLRCLHAVVIAGSMSKAAPSLGVSVAAVSRRIERLEADLGLHLLNRTTRGIRPTPDAEAMLEAAGPLLGALEDAVAASVHRETALAGHLRVTAPRAVAENFLMGWLLDVQREHPALTLDLVATDAWVDLVGAAVDIAIRVGPLRDSEATATRLGFVQYALVAPAHLCREVEDVLARDGWAGLATLPTVVAEPIRTWRARQDGADVELRPHPAVSANGLTLAAQAVAHGACIGYLPTDVAHRAHLPVVSLAPHGIEPTRRPLLAVTPRGQLRRRKVVSILDMLRTRIRDEGPTIGIQPT